MIWYGKESRVDGLERTTINPEQCGGRPCIRGMRIRVSDVLDLACVQYAARPTAPDLGATTA